MPNQRPYHAVAGNDDDDDDEPPRYQHVVGVPRAEHPSPSSPRDAAEALAELPSPVDGREPSSLPAALRDDYSKDDRVSRPLNMAAHPADGPNPTY